MISGGFDWGGLRRGKGRWLCQTGSRGTVLMHLGLAPRCLGYWTQTTPEGGSLGEDGEM